MNSLKAKAKYETASSKSSHTRVPTVSAPAPAVEDADHPFGDVPWSIREKVYYNAWDKYRFHPLDARAVLFRGRDSALARLYSIDGELGWSGLFTRGLEIVDTLSEEWGWENVPGWNGKRVWALLVPPE